MSVSSSLPDQESPGVSASLADSGVGAAVAAGREPGTVVTLPTELTALHHDLVQLLRAPGIGGGWVVQIDAVATRSRALTSRDADALLYLQVQGAQRVQEEYSSHHGLFCAVVVALCLEHLDCTDAQRQSAVLAALTMNISMTELQNDMIHRERTPTLDQRRTIDGHAQAGADMLRRLGVGDETWLEIVALHHTDPAPEVGFQALTPNQQLASVLRRVDVFTAKISSRRFRPGMPATLAARAACLGPDGRPDTVGAAVIKSLGMYPPGSYVRLANGDVAVVTRRGAKANEPAVASVIGRDGRALASATPHDTSERAYAVTGIVRAAEIRVALPPVRLGGGGDRG